MTKLILFLNVCFLFVFLGMNTSKAAKYEYYQEINFLEEGALLRDFDETEYYHLVEKRKFFGWNVHIINDKSKVKYKTETLLNYTNEGTTPIKITYETTEKDTIAFGVSTSDELGMDISGSVDKFKAGLSRKLKLSTDFDYKLESTSKSSLVIDVDPHTQLIIFIEGEGYITNGVAANYIFFIRSNLGGFEFFRPSTQYQTIVKRKIR